jgi:acyl-CoA reductase-like NAD-dependent aldehyde dehydrogenase/4-aminobutyrate aminotransferase-like enzyme/GNAT superfamily N-acetyltransferase
MRQFESLGDYINGAFVKQGGEPFASYNPARQGEVIFTAHEQQGSVDRAVSAARSALRDWRRGDAPLSPEGVKIALERRIEALRSVAALVPKHQRRIAEAICLEMGKPLSEAMVEAGSIKSKIEGVISQLDYTLPGAPQGAPGEQRFHPLGVITVIGPFNFPIHLLNTHIIPALLTGNTIVVKPSEVTPLCGQRYAELFNAANFPAGVLNVVQGQGGVGAALSGHPGVNGVIFTGSYDTGRKIRQSTFDQPHKKVCLELGGKNPAVVLDDADLDQVTREILLGALLTTGQRCTATSRVIATEQIALALKQRLVHAFKHIRPLDPLDPDCFLGPLANEASQKRFLSLLAQGRAEGAEPWVESEAILGGAFVTPSIYGVSGDEAYLQQELFGPHLSFQIVKDKDEALAWASRNTYGLSASLFTRNAEAFEEFYDEVSAGVLNWNRSTNGASGLLPFGGVGKSGNWHPAGSEGPRLSTYPVAVMRVPYGQINAHAALERQLNIDPLAQLERQHRLEEVGERFKVWLEVEGLSLRVPFAQIKVREGGFILTGESLIDLARTLGLEGDATGILLPLVGGGDHETERLEETFLKFMLHLVEIDPEPFIARPKRLISAPVDGELPRSTRWLERFYGGDFLPREKKPAVVDLAQSQGPFLRSIDDQALQIIDAASQIASLPAGFRPDAVQRDLDDGHYHDMVTQAPHPGELGAEVFDQFAEELLAFAPPGLAHICWTNSGAESNEKAFHLAKIHGPGGKRILAFNGSFHGRTLLSLYCTYNPVKRVPYQIEGHEAVFLDRPIPSSPYFNPEVPAEWVSGWSDPHGDREALRAQIQDGFTLAASDLADDGLPLLMAEVDALIALESEILAGDVLTCLIEPYQCEGGDVSPTHRFFHGLRALTRAYKIPLIFDEVQSGFGLSGPIFWHQSFEMTDAQGQPDGPDLVVCAKRAQVGLVISRWPDPDAGPSHAASAVRGLSHLRLLQELPSHEALLRERLADLTKRWSKLILRPRAFGDAFGFDLPTPEIAQHLIGQRFYQGYMVYIAGKQTIRYRMNRGFKESEIREVFRVIERSLVTLSEQAGGPGEELIERMSQCKPPRWINTETSIGEATKDTYHVTLAEALTVPGDPDLYLRRHGELSKARRAAGESALELSSQPRESDLKVLSEADPSSFERAVGFSLTHFVADRIGTRITRISLSDFNELSSHIMRLEDHVYEPARRDDMSILRAVAAHPEGVVCIAQNLEGLVGMAFASPLEEWSTIDGPNHDAHLGLRDTLYSADVTVDPTLRGQGIGHRLRGAIIQEALKARHQDGSPRYAFLSGRNRIGDANAMWGINQRWGAYVVQNFENQYGNEGASARYYRIPLRRGDRRQLPQTAHAQTTQSRQEQHMHWGVHQPTGTDHPLLSRARDLGVFDEASLTKLTLSNFVTTPYVRYAEALRLITPPGCAHLYFTSCPDEMVDKSVRVLKHNRADAQVVVSFSGTRIGGNTAAGRSMGEGDQHFNWPTLPHPNLDPQQTIAQLDELVDRLESPDRIIGVYIETIQTLTGEVLSDESWDALCAWRDRTGVPLVLSEINSGFRRSGRGWWWLDQAQGEADLVLWWAGGQIGHIFSRPAVFVAKPLSFISTWDGDQLSATRLLWQSYATRSLTDTHLSELGDQLEAILKSCFSVDVLGGSGLYRTVRTSHASTFKSELRQRGIQIQSYRDQLVFAPPLTTTTDDLERFSKTLSQIAHEIS